jgi:hypothetical protein
MAIAYVQSASVQNNSNPSAATGAIDTSGANFLVATITSNQGATGFTSFTDNKSNTNWQVAVDWTANGGDFIRIMYHENPAVGAGHTFTLTYSGSVFTVHCVAAYSGMATTSLLDKTATGTGNSTSLLTTATATTTQADELLIGCGTVSDGANSSFTAGASYNMRTQQGLAGSGTIGFLEDRIVSATGAYTASATWGGGAGPWPAAIATFKGPATGSPTLTVENASLTSTGQAVVMDSNIAVSEATATFTGQTITFVESVGIAVTEAALTLSGQNVDLLANANIVLPVTNTQMVLEGQELPFQLSVPWTEPTLTLEGQSITLIAGVPFVLAVTEASLTLTGQTINFTLDEDFTLPVTNATMAFTGQDVTLSALTSFIVPVTNGQLTFTGQDVGMFTPYATGTGGGRKCRDRAITRLLNFGR